MLRAATEHDKQPVDKTKGIASIAGMTVKEERAFLIEQRALVRRSFSEPDTNPYDPFAETIVVGELEVTAADFMFRFKIGQMLKTTANAHSMAAKKKEKRRKRAAEKAEAKAHSAGRMS